MADKQILRNVINAMIKEDVETAEAEFSKFIAEMTRDLLGEGKDDKCDECGNSPCSCSKKSDDDDSDEKDSDGDSDGDSKKDSKKDSDDTVEEDDGETEEDDK
jgi:hypothetical protein